MISWWMLNPGPKTKMFIVIKRKLITLLKLITSMQFIKIFKLSWQYIRGILRKVGLIDLIVFPYYFLVYKNLIKKKFPINPQATETQFTLEGDNNFFREKILKSKLYLEYGSGTSTLFADKNNINYYSIESDKNFFNILKPYLKNKNYILKDFGLVGSNSTPLFISYRKYFLKVKAQKYAGDILQDFDKRHLIPDLILIDGRFRILCALFVYKFLKNKNSSTTIIIDDYKMRPYLHILEELFHIEKIGSFGVCTKLKEFKDLDRLIKIYSVDAR